ncbi:MAG: BatA domain-containing protein, partial [Pseudomonadota bacterium]
MFDLTSFTFATPWVLLGLAVLPLLWFLLRVSPPAPKRQIFPAVRILSTLIPEEETPARTPWWLLLLRLLAAALIILGLARPLLNPDTSLTGSGPLVIVVDNGWAAARDWAVRQATMDRLIDLAAREERPVVIAPTAPTATTAQASTNDTFEIMSAGDARTLARGLQPQPWPVDRASAVNAVTAMDLPGSANVHWLSDGLSEAGDDALAEALQQLGGLTVHQPDSGAMPILLSSQPNLSGELTVRVQRPSTSSLTIVTLQALGQDGRILGQQEVPFEPGALSSTVDVELPLELRNDVGRIVVLGQGTAGATLLGDAGLRRRPVGIATQTLDENQPLLSPNFFVDQAVNPFGEVKKGAVSELVRSGIAVIALPDSYPLTPEDRGILNSWVNDGGMLVRFAGPTIARGEPDNLLPVALRGGDRIIGGALSWSDPATLATFETASPFAGLEIPEDVQVQRQVLAEPSLELAAKTWARLSDGTPIVTGERRESGWVVLVHTTATTEWSNLAISGLFVEMMQRLVRLSQGLVGGDDDGMLAPVQTLDAFGRLSDPADGAVAVSGRNFSETEVGPDHPPGYYGSDAARRAFNLGDALTRATARSGSDQSIASLTDIPLGAATESYGRSEEVEFAPWALTLALVLLLIDSIVGLALRGHISLALNARTYRQRAAKAAETIALVGAL